MELIEITSYREPTFYDYVGIYLYSLLMVTSFTSILALMLTYLENDYYNLSINCKELLYNINAKFDIFEEEEIDTMNIDKMNFRLMLIGAKLPLNNDNDNDSDSENGSDNDSASDNGSGSDSD